MWNYSDKVLDHFMNPRNVGEVDNPDGIGEVGSMACGDALRLSFRLDEEGRIVEAKFQTFGCGSAIASSALAIEKILGGTLAEALAVTNKELVAELELPPVKVHCSVLAEEGLQAAVQDYREKQARAGEG